MVHEKRILPVLAFVIGAIVLLSLNPSFTGYSVADGNEPALLIEEALPGSTIQARLPVQLNNDDLVSIKVVASGEAASWISFVEEEYHFLPEVESTVTLYVRIPDDTEPGEYTAKLALMSVEDAEKSSVLTDQIISYVPVNILVSSEQRTGFAIPEFTVYDAEVGSEVYFHAIVENLGNSDTAPDTSIAIYNLQGGLVTERSLSPAFVAYEQKELTTSLSDGLSPGTYYGQITVGKESKSMRFAVVEEHLKRNGELQSSTVTVEDNARVRIDTYFMNTGEAVIPAVLHGIVTQEGAVVTEFYTDEQIVLPGEYGIFSYSYAKDIHGEYTADVEVLSDNAVLAEVTKDFYSSDAISLETNVLVIFSLIMLLLIVSHYILSRRRA